MSDLKRQQTIRLSNTLLAAAGGVLLTAVLLFEYFTLTLFLPASVLWLYLSIFWLGNLTIIGIIASNRNLNFRDPALSLPQMYWAATSTVVALLFSDQLDIVIYLLLMLTLVFGIFQVKANQFNVINLYVIICILLAHCLRAVVLNSEAQYLQLFIQWITFSFCTIALTRLCLSMVVLRTNLRKKNKELENALQAKSYFLANMSHEIRTPMNGVLGMLDIVLRGDIPTEQRRYLAIAQSSATALLTVINDILDFSKIEAGKLNIEPIAFDLGQLLSDIVATFGAKAESKNIELILDVAVDSPNIVVADPVRLRQILNNILGNAFKFTESGEVVVSLRAHPTESGADLTWQVRDTGIGIEKEKFELLFESFTQADASTTRLYGGTGLGLAICKKLCVLMGGDISVTSQEGVGSCFSFKLPVGLQQETAKLPGWDHSSIAGKQILIVDDNQTNLLVLENQLKHSGAKVVVVSSAYAAIDLLKDPSALTIDLAIIDMQMPNMDGLQLATAIHQLAGWEQLSMMILTSTLEDIPEPELRAAGVSMYLNKPVLPAKLYAAVALSLKSSGHYVAAGYLNVGDDKSVVSGELRPQFGEAKKVLLVDDNITNQQVADIFLSRIGLEVETAENGRVAVDAVMQAYIENTPFDVVLMDCQMPVLDGYQATKEIRNQEREHDIGQSIPIIAMTAHTMSGDREKCLSAGMNDYIAKPILLEELQSKLMQWIPDLTLLGAAQNMAQTPVSNATTWDCAHLEKLVRNKPERMNALLRSFLDGLTAMQNGVVGALQDQQEEEALKSIHALKGASANLGAKALPAFLAQIETDIRAKGISNARDIIDALNAHSSALRRDIESYLDSSAPSIGEGNQATP